MSWGSRFTSRVQGKALSGILIELFLIFVGVLAALAVENFRQLAQEKRAEQVYLLGFRDAIRADTAMIKSEIQRCYLKLKASSELLKLADSRQVASEEEFEEMITLVIMLINPTYETAIYEELKASGNIQIVSSEELRNAIISYYVLVDRTNEFYMASITEFGYNELFTDLIDTEEFALERPFSQTVIIDRLRKSQEGKRYLQRLQKRIITLHNSLFYTQLPRAHDLLDKLNRELGASD